MLRRTLPLLLAAALAGPALAAPAPADARNAHFATPAVRAAEPSARAALGTAEAALAGRRRTRAHNLTPLLRRVAVALPRFRARDRARAQRLLARPTSGQSTADDTAYTVAEHAVPLCSLHFCIHWVDSTADAPPRADSNGDGVPDYVETMSAVFERSWAVENEPLGWRPPASDGARGCPGSAPACMNRTDVYVQELGGRGIYGYSAPDPGQRSLSQSAYLVMDNDYSAAQFPRYGGDPLQPMEVTAAHEYSHVLQFGYDVAQDTWMFEASAVWMEEQVYDDVDDYLQYLTPWAQLSFVPLTQFDAQSADNPANVKVYGDVVWNRWLESRFGAVAVRRAWEQSLLTSPKSFAPGAYDRMLTERGSSFFDAFAQFAAATAEWRTPGSPFPEGASFPDVERVRDSITGNLITLAAGRAGAGGTLPHTTYGLIDVAPALVPRIKLVADTPRGTRMALALVARSGGEAGGDATVRIERLPAGGTGTVTLDDPARYARLTAVIVNADARTTARYSRTLQDWEWLHDAARVSLRISTDFSPPEVRTRTPGPGDRGVSRTPRLYVTFSEPLARIGARTVTLTGPGGRRVNAQVVRRAGGLGVKIRPHGRLLPGRRYRVRLSADIEDGGGNPLPAAARDWSFVTAR